MNNLINRPIYINKISLMKDKDFVKILIGVRRSGKSSILKLLIRKFLEEGLKEQQILFISFEDSANKNLKSPEIFEKYIEDRIYKEGKTYLFVDEIQELEEWAYLINSFKVKYDIDIYVTGSNANIFTGKHTTYLAGRYVSFEVMPLSLIEIRSFDNNQKALSDYYNDMLEGSFPMILLEKDKRVKLWIMTQLYESVYIRDIMLSGGIRNTKQLENTARYLFENVGKTISIKKIHDTLKSNNEEISYSTLSNFFTLFESAYLLYHCRRYDLKGRQLLQTNGKFYSVDIALANIAAANNSINRGYLLENFVYLELRKAGFTINTLSVNREYEIDFIAIRANKKMFIQVSQSIVDDNTLQREVRPFKYINEDGEKIIVTRDVDKIQLENCRHMNVFEFIIYIQDNDL